jgi:hypothetical protein
MLTSLLQRITLASVVSGVVMGVVPSAAHAEDTSTGRPINFITDEKCRPSAESRECVSFTYYYRNGNKSDTSIRGPFDNALGAEVEAGRQCYNNSNISKLKISGGYGIFKCPPAPSK